MQGVAPRGLVSRGRVLARVPPVVVVVVVVAGATCCMVVKGRVVVRTSSRKKVPHAFQTPKYTME